MQTELNTLNPTRKTLTIAYWPDGYWIRDVQEAATLDRYEAFGSIPHRVTEVDTDASAEHIENQVKTLCTGWKQAAEQPCAQGTQGEASR